MPLAAPYPRRARKGRLLESPATTVRTPSTSTVVTNSASSLATRSISLLYNIEGGLQCSFCAGTGRRVVTVHHRRGRSLVLRK